jgi:hypothetical protein
MGSTIRFLFMNKIFASILFGLLSVSAISQQRFPIEVGRASSGAGGGVSSAVLADTAAAIRADILPTRVPAQRAINVVDSSNYALAPVTCQTSDGWVYMFYKLSPSHTDTGRMYMQKSRDGQNWTPPVQPVINGSVINNCGLITVGVGANDRIILAYQTSNTYLNMKYTYSDDGGVTWEATTTVGLFNTQVEVANYGRIIQVVGDTLYSPIYANFSVDTAQVGFHKSYDNGVSWSMGATIMKGLAAGIFPTGGSINETWLLKVREGATVATTQLMALIRSEKYFGYHYQWWTATGGVTTADWNSLAVDDGAWFSEYNATSGPNTFPVSAQIVYDSIIQVYIGFRGNEVTGLPSGLRVIQGPLDAYADPTLWSKPRTIYSPTAPIKQFQNDFGYPDPFIVNGQPHVVAYDISVKDVSGSSLVTTKTRGFTIPADGNNYLEMYDTAAQAITTATETRVLTRMTRLDSELFYNSDSTKIYFKYDGWYNLFARVTFDASASGTYRTATLYMIDQGDATGPSQSAMAGKYMITQQSIAPSTNAIFNRIELSGMIYAYANTELRLTVQHDVGSNLSILNSVQNNRATIKLKKVP